MKYLTYPKFGVRMGRLGNSLFQLASLLGMSTKSGRELFLPEWNYKEFFNGHVNIGERLPFKNEFNEPSYSYEGDYYKNVMNLPDTTISVSGWLQSSKYWEGQETEIKKFLSFKEEYFLSVKEKWKHVFTKPVILIGIRVGEDYVSNGNYTILPVIYQIGALYKFFPDWKENYNVLVFSDDEEYAKLNFDCRENIYFATGIDAEQMCLGTLCTHFIIPNSTFSWWQAYLGQKENSVVVHPHTYFKGELAKTHSTKDFWEKNWMEYKWEKLNLSDLSITIPVSYDHPHREENFNLITSWLHSNFNVNTMVGEQGGEKLHYAGRPGIKFYTYFYGMNNFHRTKMLNYLAKNSTTPYIANYDADNLISVMQMMLSIDELRNGEEMVYPYDGRSARVGRDKWLSVLQKSNGDIGKLKGEIFRGTRAIDPESVGHIVMWNKEKYFNIGGENENFISYGPEDTERWERALKLKVKIKRIKGITYHIDHWCGPNSSGNNPYFGANYKELEKIKKMPKKELKNYISSWEWCSFAETNKDEEENVK